MDGIILSLKQTSPPSNGICISSTVFRVVITVQSPFNQAYEDKFHLINICPNSPHGLTLQIDLQCNIINYVDS